MAIPVVPGDELVPKQALSGMRSLQKRGGETSIRTLAQEENATTVLWSAERSGVDGLDYHFVPFRLP
jgi:hypothetical protein